MNTFTQVGNSNIQKWSASGWKSVVLHCYLFSVFNSWELLLFSILFLCEQGIHNVFLYNDYRYQTDVSMHSCSDNSDFIILKKSVINYNGYNYKNWACKKLKKFVFRQSSVVFNPFWPQSRNLRHKRWRRKMDETAEFRTHWAGKTKLHRNNVTNKSLIVLILVWGDPPVSQSMEMPTK